MQGSSTGNRFKSMVSLICQLISSRHSITSIRITLAVAKLAKNQLEQKGFKDVLTREQEITVPLADRVKLFNGIKDAFVISLHFNSGKKEASGYETYVRSARQLHPANNASLALATAVHGRSLMFLNNAKYGNDFKINDRGIRRARFRLLKDSKHPAILIEAGFLSNKARLLKLAPKLTKKHWLTQ
jgi:N-acetylmuramoyl-L-alanine amidase